MYCDSSGLKTVEFTTIHCAPGILANPTTSNYNLKSELGLLSPIDW
jgi:hypothetical protein